LFVDDEANILSALKRLFRPLGYRVFTAESGAQGLAVLEREAVDLVISDMRMPEMNGAQFLEQVRLKWPEVVRILLTGYADIGSTIAAINRGEIYRYIAKPWEDNDVILVVRHALERKRLEQEKRRLEELTHRQNEELRDLNANLEAKVEARTKELRQAMGLLETAHRKLKENFLISIKVFSNLIELREGAMAGHSRRAAEHARNLAQHMGLKDAEAQDVLFAALLHDIGKIGLPDRLLYKPFVSLTGEERTEVVKHPATGEAALMALENLRGAARLIRSHHERHDGMGFPDGLVGAEIPLGARILAVANDYDALQNGTLLAKRVSGAEAQRFLIEGKGRRYDPQVVDAFIDLLGRPASMEIPVRERKVKSAELRGGMVLTRDLVTKDGMLLLSRDYLLEDSLIGKIRNFEDMVGYPLAIYVRAEDEEKYASHHAGG